MHGSYLSPAAVPLGLLDPTALFFFSRRTRHTRWPRDWSSDVCSSDLVRTRLEGPGERLLPANLEKALARALESSPDARYRTALEFADALTATHEGGLFSR